MNTNYKLSSKDHITEIAKSYGIDYWNNLMEYVKNLPYGRNENRTNLELVLTEGKGTCSSKHALLKTIADLNGVPNVDLIIGIYRMTALNTPIFGTILNSNSIEYIPEAHCYLKIKGKRIDLTSSKSGFEKIEKDIIQEKTISPSQVAKYKVEYHKSFLKNWLQETNIEMALEQIWRIREKCIENLTE